MGSSCKFRSSFQSKPFLRDRTLNGCTSSSNVDDVVLIDIDSNDYHDVIIVDLPDSLINKIGKHSTSNIISIDEEEEENTDGIRGVDHNTTSTSTSSPVIISKYKRTYSGKSGSRNRYGFCSGSENDSSDTDCSDCELMEGSSGKLREQWEQAFLKRKNHNCTGQSGTENCADSHASSPAAHLNAGEENREKRRDKDLDSCSSTHPSYDDETFSTVTIDGDDILGKTYFNHSVGNAQIETDVKEAEGEDYLSADAGHGSSKQFDDGYHPFCNEDHTAQKTTMSSGLEKDDSLVNVGMSYSHDREQDILVGPCLYNCQASFEEHFGLRMSDACCEEDPNFKSKLHSEDADPCKIPSLNVNGEFGPSNECSPEKKTSFKEQEYFNGKDSSCSDIDLQNKAEKAVVDGQKVDEECLHGTGYYDGDLMEDERAKESPSGDSVVDDENDIPGMGAKSSQDDIIIDRQKLKETDEYKRAMEEELASRQQQLQIQAEEAQRLRRRKRAESMRLMDMEKRQKQRLKEIRETQKKDTENMNLREELRANIRDELYKLEVTCSDMASLLRRLGVHLGSNPSLHEVQAAYKRAVLRFHPDRASRGDLRQQVESEERFKLISRMREKFLLTT